MRLRARKGQIIVLVVLLIPVLVGMVGVALDTTNLIAHRDHAQDAADLAALGASADLPTNLTAARTSALRFAAANGHANGVNGISVVATTPFNSDSTQIQVKVLDTVPIMFMRLFGFTKLVVGGTAVASGGATMPAMFASGACGASPSGVSWLASSSTITGALHTNGNLSIGGSGSTFTGPETYVCTSSTTMAGGTLPPPTKVAAKTSPVIFNTSSFTCTTNFAGNIDMSGNGAWWVNGVASSLQLKTGTYCATGSITFKPTVSGVHGTVTFVAGTTVAMTANSFTVQPAQKNVLFYADGTGGSSISGAGGVWSGVLNAPKGTIVLTGSGNWQVSGAVMAAAITVNGAGLKLNSTGVVSPKPILVQ